MKNGCAIFLATTPPNYHTTPTFSGARRRNLDTAQLGRMNYCILLYENVVIYAVVAIAIVLTKQTMGVTVIISIIITGSKVSSRKSGAASELSLSRDSGYHSERQEPGNDGDPITHFSYFV